jgi:hypothetical protein
LYLLENKYSGVKEKKGLRSLRKWVDPVGKIHGDRSHWYKKKNMISMLLTFK